MKDFRDTTKVCHVTGPKSAPQELRGAAQVARTIKAFKEGPPPAPTRRA